MSKLVSIAAGWRMDGLSAELREVADKIDAGEIKTAIIAYMDEETGKMYWNASGPDGWVLQGIVAQVLNDLLNSYNSED